MPESVKRRGSSGPTIGAMVGFSGLVAIESQDMPNLLDGRIQPDWSGYPDRARLQGHDPGTPMSDLPRLPDVLVGSDREGRSERAASLFYGGAGSHSWGLRRSRAPREGAPARPPSPAPRTPRPRACRRGRRRTPTCRSGRDPRG